MPFALKGQSKKIRVGILGLPFQGASAKRMRTEDVALGYNGNRLSGEVLQQCRMLCFQSAILFAISK
ncbi:MAG: hypothetical protein ACREFE_13185 [Limisphaerales bacterium]